jgi:hypothetical protein
MCKPDIVVATFVMAVMGMSSLEAQVSRSHASSTPEAPPAPSHMMRLG